MATALPSTPLHSPLYVIPWLFPFHFFFFLPIPVPAHSFSEAKENHYWCLLQRYRVQRLEAGKLFSFSQCNFQSLPVGFFLEIGSIQGSMLCKIPFPSLSGNSPEIEEAMFAPPACSTCHTPIWKRSLLWCLLGLWQHLLPGVDSTLQSRLTAALFYVSFRAETLGSSAYQETNSNLAAATYCFAARARTTFMLYGLSKNLQVIWRTPRHGPSHSKDELELRFKW